MKLEDLSSKDHKNKIANGIGVFTLLSFILLISACRKDNKSDFEPFIPSPCSDTIYFQSEVKLQIIDMSCNVSNCHDANTAAAGYDFSTHLKIVPLTHSMYKSMAHDSGFAPMPSQNFRIADSLLQKFYCWIQQGKLDN